jgi:hypothetical protein
LAVIGKYTNKSILILNRLHEELGMTEFCRQLLVILDKPCNSHIRKIPVAGSNKITVKLTSGRFALEKLQVNSGIAKLNAFVIWYFSRTIVRGQMLASESMASRD